MKVGGSISSFGLVTSSQLAGPLPSCISPTCLISPSQAAGRLHPGSLGTLRLMSEFLLPRVRHQFPPQSIYAGCGATTSWRTAAAGWPGAERRTRAVRGWGVASERLGRGDERGQAVHLHPAHCPRACCTAKRWDSWARCPQHPFLSSRGQRHQRHDAPLAHPAGHARAVEQQLSALEAELRKLRQQQPAA